VPNITQSTIALIETYYWKYKRLPSSDEDLFREYMVETSIADVLSEAKYLKYLGAHGVPVDGTPTLSPKQVRWIDTICAAGDTRPLTIKAKEAGVALATHNAWLKNPLFQGALTSRLESILPDERSRVHQALAREASGGNISAIKLYMQMTGEYTEEATGKSKAETAGLMQGILEILETHVDRGTLLALADDFDYLLVHGTPPLRKKVSVVPRQTGKILEIDEMVNDLT
jgi:Helix-turn-helix of insertion element transposase